MFRMLCDKCFWYMDNVGMKPVCPDCKNRLLVVNYNNLIEVEELTNKLKQNKKTIDK